MKMALLAALAFVGASSLLAQVTAELKRFPDGSLEVYVRNDSKIDLAAYVVRLDYASDGSLSIPPLLVYSDEEVEMGSAPLPPGRQVKASRAIIRFAGNSKIAKPVSNQPFVTAGILADGSAIGDSTLLIRLMVRRGSLLLAIETSLETLLEAGRRNVPRQQLIEQFRKLAGGVRRAYLLPEQQVGPQLYQSIAGKLLTLPEGKVGEPFPPSDFVAQETLALNRQRLRLTESQPSLMDIASMGR